MMQFGWDHPAPGTVILISGDRDFAYGVSVLRLRHYKVVIMAPSALVHDSLRYQASEFYDWDIVILGKHVNSRSTEGSHRHPSAPLTLNGHARLPSAPELSRISVQLPTPITAVAPSNNPHPSTLSGRPRDPPAPDPTYSMRGFENATSPRQHMANHSQESSASDRYTDTRSLKGKETWGSVGSSVSPATFVCSRSLYLAFIPRVDYLHW